VRIALEWKGIEYEYKAVHLVKDGGQQNADEYTAFNPMAQVPSFIVDGVVMTQSMAILEYIEEAYPSQALLPTDKNQRFKVREICEIIGSGIQPLQNLSVLKQFEQSKQKEWASRWIAKGFHALEQVLAGCSGKYCVGDQVSLADCFLPPQIYNANRFEVDMEPYPHIVRIGKNLDLLEPFQKAHPSEQPDTPADLIV